MYIFTPNTLIKSSEVNDNFTGLDTRVTDLEAIPAFKARRNTNLNSGNSANVDIVFDSEYYDYQSNYSTSTGLFTAPYAGLYWFSASAFTESVTTTRAFLNNRGTYTPVERPIDGFQTTYNRIQGVWLANMTAGQTFGISLWTNAVNQLNSVDTWFAGYLVRKT